MNAGRPLSIAGGFIAIFGIVFHLQGYGIVGPESSFMYSNSEWITYGLQIMILGIIVLASGVVIWIKNRI